MKAKTIIWTKDTKGIWDGATVGRVGNKVRFELFTYKGGVALSDVKVEIEIDLKSKKTAKLIAHLIVFNNMKDFKIK